MTPAASSPTRQRGSWMPALVLALGAGAILLLLANNRIQQSLIAPDVGSLRAVEEIKTRVTVTHLWIEEYVTGDDVDLDKIEKSLARAGTLVSSLESRGAMPVEGFALARLGARPGAPEHEAIRALTARVAAEVGRFDRLTRIRQSEAKAGADVGIGSAVDIEYDHAFAELDDELRGLEQALILRLADSTRRAALLFRGLVIAWSSIIVLAALTLWTRERRHRLTETALGDSQAQLLQAQKMEAVGQLAGGLAHDINNYLAAIAAQSELVKMKAEPGSSTAQRMEAVLATTGRASALIERLLAFSRRQPARPESVDMNQVLESLDGMLRQLLGEDIELETRLAPELWPIEIDVSQLEQIVLNLAVNAREAMSTGGTLTLATRNVTGPGRQSDPGHSELAEQVALSVTDTGPGIPEPLQSKVFEPFFTTKENTHSGLGLATVLGVVEQNGGWIDVRSSETGTRFEVRLPRGLGTPATRPPQAQTVALPDAESARILLVEDNDDLRRSARDLLAAWGYAVSDVSRGQEAVELFGKGGGFDLMITDVVMPGMSGRQLAERVQAIEPDLPVLYISGHADDVVLRHGLETGQVDLLEKPFSARQLAARVQGALAASARSVTAETG